MAQEGSDLYGDTLSCSICMNRLKEPVTISCGHSYCKTCINRFWDGEAVNFTYTCPQCKKMFTRRPDLGKNTMIEEVLEKINKSSQHLQPHHESAAFQRHTLVDPSKKLQEKICSRHNEVMKIFCRTDQQFICYLCSMDEHKGHNIVSAAEERTEKQRELQESQADVQKNIQDREKDVDRLKQQVKKIKLSADQTEEKSEQKFTEMISLLQNRRSELKKEVQSKQQTEVSRAQDLQKKLEQEISKLKKRNAELQQISTTDDDIQFVLSYRSLSALSVSTHSSIILKPPKNCFKEVKAAVSKLREHLDKVLMEDWTKVCPTVKRVDDLLTPESVNRDGFLKYSQQMTLDPNTAYIKLRLSEGNRKITVMSEDQDYPTHPDRFTDWCQVLSRESVTGRCYWEVEMSGGRVDVSVTYKSIERAEHRSGFGYNNKSWNLSCETDKYRFFHDDVISTVPVPHSSRIGVYVDHTAGILSFYSICDTMTLIHRVNTTFTEPLHLGLWMEKNVGETAELCTP